MEQPRRGADNPHLPAQARDRCKWHARSCGELETLVRTANNSGSDEVLVPAGLSPGQYVVRVQSSVNSSVFADSAEFTVECAGSAPAISQVAAHLARRLEAASDVEQPRRGAGGPHLPAQARDR